MAFFESALKRLQNKEKDLTPIYPKNAIIELSNSCNHACLFCHNSVMEREVGKLSFELFKKFLDQALPLGLEELGIYATGEPFVNRNISDFIEYASNSGVKRIYCTSNGALANIEIVEDCIKKGLQSIKFSINASNQADYKTVHGKDDWLKINNNIKAIRTLVDNSYPHVKLVGSCIMTSITGDISVEHRAQFSGLLDDISYGFAGNQGGRTLDHVKKISQIPNVIEMHQIKPCEMLWSRWHLTYEGYLTACCVDYENDLVYADINHDSIKSAWHNTLIQSLRKKHLDRDLTGTICASCLTNKYYEYEPISDIGRSDSSKFISPELLLKKQIKLKERIDNAF